MTENLSKLGGSVGHESATAQGGIYVLERYLEKKKNREVKTAVIQGFGNVGGHMARLLHEKEFMFGSIRHWWGIYSEKGIDIPNAFEALKEHGTVAKTPGYESITNEELLLLPCDLLVLGALENQIRADNVDKVSANMLMELANGPLTQKRIRFSPNGESQYFLISFPTREA